MSLTLDFFRGIGSVLYHMLRNLILLFVPTSWISKDVSKDVVLITGSGSGIGREMAFQFAKLGSTLVLWDVNTKGNEETSKKAKKDYPNCKVHTYTVDITNRELVYQTAKDVAQQVGSVTILINNAGIVNGNSGFLDIPDKRIEMVMNVNTMSHFWTIKAFLPDMLKLNRGHIVCIASYASMGGTAYLVDYSASKFAVLGLMESLTMELEDQGRTDIATTTVCPYYINTGMFSGVQCNTMPMSQASDVAKRVVKAVLTNETLVVIPAYARPLAACKLLVPIKSLPAVLRGLGVSNNMKTFKGR